MMGKAIRVRQIPSWKGDAVLYKVDPPVDCEKDFKSRTPEVERRVTTEYVIVSAVVVAFSGAETYIFPADKDGNVLDWIELDGSFRGELSHEKALLNAGYEVGVATND